MFILSESCVDCQPARRDSNGCVDVVGCTWEPFTDEGVDGSMREERRVSCTPGADGAPPVVELVLLIEEAWLNEGAMRRA